MKVALCGLCAIYSPPAPLPAAQHTEQAEVERHGVHYNNLRVSVLLPSLRDGESNPALQKFDIEWRNCHNVFHDGHET